MPAAALQFDVVIVGAGPSGLSFAAALRELPLRIALVEQLGAGVLADPPYDGREIALTQRSARLMRELGIWDRLPAGEIAPLCGARVLNGQSPRGLDIQAPGATAPASRPELGYLVSNHLIRRASWENVTAQDRLERLLESRVAAVATDATRARVTLADGRELAARLVVAADTRFSATRRAMGIPARQRDFGKTMLVCRMQHELPHEQVAVEWFGEGQTLALLPMNGQRSSVVLTLRHADIERLLQLAPAAFGREMEQRFAGRLGRMTLEGERFAYPLVAVYPERFHATRYAVIGDAAVGMHPVTAHGYNFGLRGAHSLAMQIATACRGGTDIGAPDLLARYDAEHRRATRPLYLATNAIVGLFTDESLPARLLRRALLQFASRAPPVASLLSALLMEEGGRDARPRALPSTRPALP